MSLVKVFVLFACLLATFGSSLAETGRLARPDGSTITYYLDRPQSDRFPLLVILQGSECLRVSDKFQTFVELLNRQEVAVLRVEKPGLHEGVEIGECPSEYLLLNTPSQRVLDLLSVLSYLRKNETGFNGRLALTGGSEGAMIAALSAPLVTGLEALVLFSGGGGTSFGEIVLSSVREQMRVQGASETDIQGQLRKMQMELDEIKQSPVSTKEWLSDGQLARNSYRWWAEAWDIQLHIPLSRTTVPILALQGNADTSVTPEHSLALQEKLGPRLTLQTYQGDHVPPQEVIAESLSWAARKLSDSATPARSIGE